MADTTSEWVEVWSCAWIHQAQFLRSVLEGAGIEALLPDEHTLGVDPSLAPAFGGVRLLVHADDLDQARELIESASNEDSV